MTSIFALSVADQIERAGAYVGLASFFGLAALTILYFSQARELKRLRDWAGRAPERARELEERVIAHADASRIDVAAEEAAPVPVPAAVAVPSAPAMPAEAFPAVALAAAAAFAPAKPGAAAASAASTVVPVAPASGNGHGDETQLHPAVSPPPPNGIPSRDGVPAVPAAATAAARNTATTRPAGPTTVRAGGRAGGPALPPRRPAPVGPGARRPAPAAPARTRGPHRTRNIALGILAAFLVAGGGVVAATQLGGSTPVEPNSTGAPIPEGGGGAVRTDAQTPAGQAATATPADTTVSVLNGTTTTGLAATLAQKIEEAGFDRGTTGNNTDQQRPTSAVLYAEGFRPQAEQVAQALRITDIQRLDPDTQRLASGDKVAEVVVIAGTDQTP